MFGVPLREKTFHSISDMRKFRYDYSMELNIHGNYNPTVQFMHKTYKDDIHYNYNDLIIYSIDIETTTTKGFPNVDLPEEEITMITLSNLKDDSSVVFLTLDADLDVVKREYPLATLYKFSDEVEMLKKFIVYFSNNYPHILTSYNGEGFDIPYMTNRMIGLLPKAYYERLSPWRNISISEKKDSATGEIYLDYSWKGIQLIDYLPLYKKFSQTSPENYKLDTVAEYELGERKVENPYGSFQEFYEKDPTLFAKYNIT